MNRKIIGSITLSLTLMLCTNISAQKHEKMKFDNKEIVGELSIKQLENVDGFENLFINEDTKSDKKQLEKLINLLQGVTIEAYIGTWCDDTQYYFPQIISLLRQANYDINAVKIIGLNKEKKSPNGTEAERKIEFVPTIIFFKDKKEIGRFVEQPKQSILKDFIKILS